MKHDASRSNGKAPKPKAKPKRPLESVAIPSAAEARSEPSEASSPRKHGDSYAEVTSREEDFSVTTSAHGERPDRRLEEPSESPLDAPERLEGST